MSQTKMLLHGLIISIPAPTKGATLSTYGRFNTLGRFQSPHPRRVRPAVGLGRWFDKRDFNPRTHEGCDPSGAPWQCTGRHFNPRTHEGCDKSGKPVPLMKNDFNPRTHEGCDNICSYRRFYGRGFQSPHPRRVRPPQTEFRSSCHLFQSPHPRRVRRYRLSRLIRIRRISIPAPTKGATYTTPTL